MPVETDEYLASQAMEARAYNQAVSLLKPLAERNSEYALLSLGWIYETGATTAPDKAAARAFYEQAAAHGSVNAYHYLGSLLLSEGEEKQAREAFERGAHLNNVECKTELARLHDKATEKLARKALEKQAYEEAVCLLRPLAERNSEYALICLGWIYEGGVRGAPDHDAARSYYERAASQGSVLGSFELGRFLGKLGKETQARAAFQAGAEQAYPPSMARLGRMMVEGRGGPLDFDAGIEWLEKAASQGHIHAQRTLLAVEARRAKSIFEKLSVRLKIAALAVNAVREAAKHPGSNRLR
jgi:hypothetical protein